jgi:hypothetical protein
MQSTSTASKFAIGDRRAMIQELLEKALASDYNASEQLPYLQKKASCQDSENRADFEDFSDFSDFSDGE